MPGTPNQDAFVRFLIEAGVLTFGDFTTKSGRKTPYFINTGNFDDGSKISRLGSFLAAHLHASFSDSFSVVFGPAYKGISLAVATAVAFERDLERNVPFTFNRKEAKTHGDKGTLVGHQLIKGDRVVIVEDVITAGTTLQEVIPMLRGIGVGIAGVSIIVDRRERGKGTISALQEIEQEFQIRIAPVITVYQIIDYLERGGSTDTAAKIREYLSNYGVGQDA